MGKRTDFADVAAMALIFRHDADMSVSMIAYDKVKQFDEIINQNLDEINSNISLRLYTGEYSELYFYSHDENGKTYLVIDPHADINDARSFHIGTLPLDVVIAAQKSNALAAIGLKLVNGKLYLI